MFDKSVVASTTSVERSWSVIFFILIFLFMLAGRWLHQQLEADHIRPLLQASAFLIHLFTGAPYEWRPQQGVVFDTLGLIMDRSCGGGNFLLIVIASCFWWCRSLLLTRLLIPLLIVIPASGLLLVILNNTFRTLATLMAIELDPTAWIAGTALFHQFLGIIIQLLLLFLCHAIIRNGTRRSTGQA